MTINSFLGTVHDTILKCLCRLRHFSLPHPAPRSRALLTLCITITVFLHPCCSLRWNALPPFSAHKSFFRATPPVQEANLNLLATYLLLIRHLTNFFITMLYFVPHYILECISYLLKYTYTIQYPGGFEMPCVLGTDKYTNQTTDQKEIKNLS